MVRFLQLFESMALLEFRIIKSAAVRHNTTGEILPCKMHYYGWVEAVNRGWFPDAKNDAEFNAHIDAEGLDYIYRHLQDGFVSTQGQFLDHTEAWKLARKNNEIEPASRNKGAHNFNSLDLKQGLL